MSSDETISSSSPAVGPELPISDQPFGETLTLQRLNPLVAAAAALLGLCAHLKSSRDHFDVEELRLRVLREIDAFQRRIMPLKLPMRAIKLSKYALCATIDDIVLNTAWGSHSVWTTRSMVGTLFGETWGGDRFFELLEQIKKTSANDVDLLELLYYCMRLGFEGRFRVAPRGASELSVLCEDTYRLIRAARGDFERDIAPHWQERSTERGPPRKFAPPWAAGAFGAAAVLSLYVGLLVRLDGQSDAVVAKMATLPPRGAVSLARTAAPPPIVVSSDRLRRFLDAEIRDGLVAVTEDAQQILVTIRASGMFDSASSIVKDSFVPLFLRIGRALNEQPGAVLLTGHTDSMPIQSQAYPSNQDLSTARAKAAAEIIRSTMSEPGHVREEGRGSGEPIASNRTREGRAKNRRIEIAITKPS
ncbi:type IVB secretion system protein IcmH/DotU [Mesorhizobium silamurunense]|uniref:type IVB secretion system protein IcmH/DotU n=1 Tax=Mesorhizobium silamurunense TaxID=499528 RepID=UPI0017828F71|nr:type IVB secretion system protein IcmH/DotU [Mesorhizobium silamurunense]